MIKDFYISNFRHFKDLQLEQLKQVNLFVGRNSAGKSALLEAFLLFFTQMSVKHLPEIHAVRQENWEPKSDYITKSTARHLFRNHKLPEMGAPGFKLSSKGDPRSFEAKIRGYYSEADGPMTTFRIIEDDLLDADPDFLEPFLVLEKDEHTQRLVRVSRYSDGRRIRSIQRYESANNAFFVPTRGVTDEDVSYLWDAISLTESEQDVIDGLKLIEPNVEGVAFVGSERDRIALVKLKNQNEPVSLKSLGDGMSRILQIILSLVNAKNSVLLVDEFENGLHWGIQKDVWELIFKLAQRFDVQVFATTHSRDCIEGFEEAWSKNVDMGSFARVYRKDDDVFVREYSFELLKDSIETDVEVR